MVFNKIPENYDLRKILEALLDEHAKGAAIDNLRVKWIIEKGKPD